MRARQAGDQILDMLADLLGAMVAGCTRAAHALRPIIEEPTMREIRYLDKLIDELAKGKAMEKILRTS